MKSSLPLPPRDKKLYVLTRDRSGNASWKKHLEAQGYATYLFPCIEPRPLPLTTQRRAVYRTLSTLSGIVCTSRHALEALRVDLAACGIAPEVAPPLYLFAGDTEVAARAYGFTIRFAIAERNAESLALSLPLTDTPEYNHLLVLQSDRSLTNLPTILSQRGARVTTLVVYETLLITDASPEFEALLGTDRVRAILFASPSAVTAFCKRLSPRALCLAQKTDTFAIGPTTKKALLASGFTDILIGNDRAPLSSLPFV